MLSTTALGDERHTAKNIVRFLDVFAEKALASHIVDRNSFSFIDFLLAIYTRMQWKDCYFHALTFSKIVVTIASQ